MIKLMKITKEREEDARPLVPHRKIYSWNSLTRKNINVLRPGEGVGLAKCLTVLDLISYGVGSTVGAGIFVTVGIVAAEKAGPGILLSFLFAGFACLLSAFCYSEFAASIPVSGSAYTFSYVALGEFIGWFIGWNLTLEYTISASAVARGWAGYVGELFVILGVELPTWFTGYPVNSFINFSPLSVIIVALCTFILAFGVKDSARFNLIITILNFCTILFVIVLGAFYVDTANWHPFLPYELAGAFKGAGTVFFSYVGFDSVSSLAGEVKRPSRDLPIGIVGTLLIATILYVCVSLVITGMVNYKFIDLKAPLSAAFTYHGLEWASILIAIGSVTALTATTLCSLLGQPRIYFQMAKDGLIHPNFGTINPKTQAPIFGTLVTGVLAGLLALLLDLGTLADMISIGTLLAFTVVCAGVVVMRLDKHGSSALKLDKVIQTDKTSLLHNGQGRHGWMQWLEMESVPVPVLLFAFFVSAVIFSVIFKEFWPPWAYALPCVPMSVIYLALQMRKQINIPTTFKCPLVPLLPLLGVLVNTFLIMQLPYDALLRILIWSSIGFAIYFGYGIRHSKLNDGTETPTSDAR